MSFQDRLYNTLGSGLYLMLKHFILNPKWEGLIDELFPDDPRSQRPSLSELEKETGLALQFGSPLIMDGMRPVSPNYVMIGMMNCKKGQSLPNGIKKFMEGILTYLKMSYHDLCIWKYLM